MIAESNRLNVALFYVNWKSCITVFIIVLKVTIYAFASILRQICAQDFQNSLYNTYDKV